MGTQANPHGNSNDGDMPAEIDFSKGTRGKFFRAGARISLPVYLEAEVQDYLAKRAKACGIEVAELVNELLKKDIECMWCPWATTWWASCTPARSMARCTRWLDSNTAIQLRDVLWATPASLARAVRFSNCPTRPAHRRTKRWKLPRSCT